jgi:N-acetylglucosamine-6-phosphate deacetylase
MEVYRKNIPVIAKVMETKEIASHILGIHIEGPFISSLSGARGAHNRKIVQTPNIQVYDELQELASGKIIIVTLAPEMEGAEALVRHITRDGTVIVSLGHHMADKAQIQMACKAGARACTHLGNGIPNILPRHTNPIWVQMAEDSLMGMFITDGYHLPPFVLRSFFRAKPVGCMGPMLCVSARSPVRRTIAASRRLSVCTRRPARWTVPPSAP